MNDFARGLADGEQAVIVQDHGPVAAEMGDDPLALGEVLGDAFVRVVADPAIEPHGLLRDHAQAATQSGERHPGFGVNMHRAVHVRTAAQHPAVQGKARTVDAGQLVEVVVHVDLDEVRGRYLGPQQVVPLHEKFAVLAGHAHRTMIVDDVVPAVMRDQAVDRGKVDTGMPFRRRHAGSRFA